MRPASRFSSSHFGASWVPGAADQQGRLVFVDANGQPVRFEAKRRVSKASAEFFLDWVRERTKRVKISDAAQRDEVLVYHLRAEAFWRKLATTANAK